MAEQKDCKNCIYYQSDNGYEGCPSTSGAVWPIPESRICGAFIYDQGEPHIQLPDVRSPLWDKILKGDMQLADLPRKSHHN